MTPAATATRDTDTDTETRAGNGGGPGNHDHVELLATGDPPPPAAAPLILNDAYFQLNGVNLRCLVKHLEIVPENKLVTITSFCAEIDYPGVTKWHMRVTFHQSFDAGATYATLNAAYQNYLATGAQATFQARPHASQVASATNPVIAGSVIPMPFELLIGDAGAGSEVAIDWNMTSPPSVNTGAVAATGAQAGAPGFFTPSGAATPANLAALGPIAATPATVWPSGNYVITADLLAAYWSGSAWTAGKAP
jgi:hypothetical protein